MDLIQAKIAEIKNLNAIYVFTTDDILKDNSNKYIGARVVYDKDKTLSLDYKSKYFGEFIKKILLRYNKEKTRRDIILLGDLTKQLVEDSLFTISEEKQEFIQPSGILVDSKKNQIKVYQKYLDRALKIIFKAVKKYDYVTINSIDGFNYKYVVNYSVGNIKKELYMLIFVKEDGNLDFRISNIDNSNVNINGTIEDKFNSIEINWYEDVDKFKGSIIYDSKDRNIREKLYKDEDLLVSRETEDTLLDEDEAIISFYMNLCGLDISKNIMKIDDNCYLLSDSKVLVEDQDGIFYNNTSCMISVFEKDVIVKETQKSGISKYNDQIKAVLEEKLSEFTLKKIEIDNKFYILIEKKIKENGNTNYNYSVLSLNNEKDLFTPFDIQNKHEINEEFKTFDKAKQYIKEMRGGTLNESI